ncbi:phosphatidate cytidylyltransferase [Candidatus Schneideria nysicola]|uniref:phosphatidate cytidylyltransferase n=1 Tax=Candidatus Schneideria nysicola TaxID=1081631 RepID=UPI001CAA818D|nr:phosphatidate cytidylyltransferase [Candidatus Schneideria nysicola]UAJ64979.1 phosphatidate cytidylyltransferase [Candidatus Schneideria nysicola]
MLKQRLMTTIIMIPMVMATIFLLSSFIFSLITLLLCLLGAWEWGRLTGLSLYGQFIWLLLISILLCIVQQSLLFNFYTQSLLEIALFWWIIAFTLILYYPRSILLWYRYKIILLIFGILIIVPFFLGILLLHHSSIGSWLLFYILSLVWSMDSGSYIFGYIGGRSKMIPKISPDKTWEGFLGGLLTTSFVSIIFYKNVPDLYNISPIALLISSVISSFASVLGDLTESMFKRISGVKDSSHLIPGHGGLLDRIDSLTAAIPIFCLLMLFFNAI